MNKRMLQKGSHHAILAIVMVVGLVGVLGFVGYNSWKKQSAGAAGASLLGRVACPTSRFGCSGTSDPTTLKTRLFFQASPNGSNKYFMYDPATNKVVEFTNSALSPNFRALGVSPNGEFLLVDKYSSTGNGSMVLASVSLTDSTVVEYDVPSSIKKCPSVSGLSGRSALVRDDRSIYYVDQTFNCADPNNPVLTRGIIKQSDKNNVISQKFPGATDVLNISAITNSGVLYSTNLNASKFVSTDSQGANQVRFESFSNGRPIRAANSDRVVYSSNTQILTLPQYGSANQTPSVRGSVANNGVALKDATADLSKLIMIEPSGSTMNVEAMNTSGGFTGVYSMGNRFKDAAETQPVMHSAVLSDEVIVYSYADRRSDTFELKRSQGKFTNTIYSTKLSQMNWFQLYPNGRFDSF